MLATAQRVAKQAAADTAQMAAAAVNTRIDHPSSPTVHADISCQATPDTNDNVNMSGGAGRDIYAMIISPPTTPIPPLSITDDYGAHRLRSSYNANKIFQQNMAEIMARVATTTAEDDDAAANGTDINMNTPSCTPHAPRIAVDINAAGPATAFDGAVRYGFNHTRIGAAPDAAQSAVGFTAMGTASSSIAGGAAGPNVADGADTPARSPPPPYTEGTNPAPQAVAQPSQSRHVSSHSRRRSECVAAAAASVRANQLGSARFPIPIDD